MRRMPVAASRAIADCPPGLVVREGREDAVHLLRIRDGGGGEVVPHARVGLRRQQRDDGVVDGAAGTTDLLVVGDGRGRRADVHDETQVGLVEAHTERRRGHQGLDLVGAQGVLEAGAGVRVELAGVRRDRVPGVRAPHGSVDGRSASATVSA